MDAIKTLISENAGSAPALEPIAMVALDAGRMMMEAGASATGVKSIVERFALGLGAERVDLRIGYASLAITIGVGQAGITRMRKVGHLGVNQRLDQGSGNWRNGFRAGNSQRNRPASNSTGWHRKHRAIPRW